MPEGVYNLGQHPFAKDWDGDRSTVRSALVDLLQCPISLGSIENPVTIQTASNQSMHPFDRQSVAEWLRQRTQDTSVHPLTREAVVGFALDEGTAKIIQLLLSHQPVAQPPGQHVMDDPRAPLVGG